MRTGKFFRFTIKGDNLDPVALKEAAGLPCGVFIKGETIEAGILKREVVQKINRWVYHTEAQDETKVEAFLTKNLEVIVSKIQILKEFANQNEAILELIVYADNHTDLLLSRKHIKLLSEIDIDLDISFC